MISNFIKNLDFFYNTETVGSALGEMHKQAEVGTYLLADAASIYSALTGFRTSHFSTILIEAKSDILGLAYVASTENDGVGKAWRNIEYSGYCGDLVTFAQTKGLVFITISDGLQLSERLQKIATLEHISLKPYISAQPDKKKVMSLKGLVSLSIFNNKIDYHVENKVPTDLQETLDTSSFNPIFNSQPIGL